MIITDKVIRRSSAERQHP